MVYSCVVLCVGCCFVAWFVLVFVDCDFVLFRWDLLVLLIGYCYGFWIYLYFCFGCMLLLVHGRFGYAGCLGWVGFAGRLVLNAILWFVDCWALVWVFAFELVGFGRAGCIVCLWLIA